MTTQQPQCGTHPWRTLTSRPTSRRAGLRLGIAGVAGMLSLLAAACDGGEEEGEGIGGEGEEEEEED